MTCHHLKRAVTRGEAAVLLERSAAPNAALLLTALQRDVVSEGMHQNDEDPL